MTIYDDDRFSVDEINEAAEWRERRRREGRSILDGDGPLPDEDEEEGEETP